MSHPNTHHDFSPEEDDNNDNLLTMKPRPKRPFELSSPPPSEPPTPSGDEKSFSLLQVPQLQPQQMDGSSTPARTRSILNLTSSTLFGIYQPTGYATEREEPSTPWGTGAETPTDRQSPTLPADFSQRGRPSGSQKSDIRRCAPASRIPPPRRGFKRYVLPLVGRTIALFALGICYGLLITHLHDRQHLAPVEFDINRGSWLYLTLWGGAGVLLGEALPWLDTLWSPGDEQEGQHRRTMRPEDERDEDRSSRSLGTWNDVLRSTGAFIGVAFAIRKLPWQSTLQLSLTLALANPAIWYIIDRSPPGFLLSTIVAVGGTGILLGVNPDWVPRPTPFSPSQLPPQGNVSIGVGTSSTEDLVMGMWSQESVGVATWIASVLFVSSVCFGNIGRRLSFRDVRK